MSVLPIRCRRYLGERGLEFVEQEDAGQKGIVLKRFVLPDGRFDVATADILILLPAGYPDVAPDMFYSTPWLRLGGTPRYPRAADQAVTFGEIQWQRWSRHNDAWRPGTDGIWTMIKRIETALELAA